MSAVSTVNVGREEIRNLIRSYIEQSQNPDLRTYGEALLQEIRAGADERHFWEIEYLMALGKLHDRRVLEIGCGFGWDAMALTILGNNEVVALDVRESMTRPLDEFLSKLRSKGRDIRLTTLTGDLCAIDIEPESFDAVYSHEAIEHVRDLNVMFGKCRRLLKLGGSFVFADDSNALNSRVRQDTQEMWERRDKSEAYIEELKRERPIENQGIAPYAVMRAKIIREANPTLSKDEVKMLADATAGMMQAELRRNFHRLRTGHRATRSASALLVSQSCHRRVLRAPARSVRTPEDGREERTARSRISRLPALPAVLAQPDPDSAPQRVPV